MILTILFKPKIFVSVTSLFNDLVTSLSHFHPYHLIILQQTPLTPPPPPPPRLKGFSRVFTLTLAPSKALSMYVHDGHFKVQGKD